MKAVAFSPGHITGFFELCYDDQNNISGSRGGGLCISLGSTAYAHNCIKGLSVTGNIGNGEVTRESLKKLVKKNLCVLIQNDLPFSQGFGMSGTSSLAASLAAASIYSINHKKAIMCAHLAEVKYGSGYGDVIPSFFGGIEMRISPSDLKGIKKKNEYAKIIIAVIGSSLNTRKALGENMNIDAINDAGKDALHNLSKNFSLLNLMENSYYFSIASGLASKKIIKLLKDINKTGKGAMCMLGNSIFAVYDKKVKKILSSYPCYECYIENDGAKVLATFFP